MGKKKGTVSVSGKYESIRDFFLKNVSQSDEDRKKLFSEEYPKRSYPVYKSKYYDEYDLDMERTTKCTDVCWYEEEFTAEVANYLRKNKYELQDDRVIKNHDGSSFYPDMVAVKDGLTYIIEVKGCYHMHRIQTGIGQLLHYQFLSKDNCKGILIYPGEFMQHVDPSGKFCDYVKNQFKDKIEIWGLSL